MVSSFAWDVHAYCLVPAANAGLQTVQITPGSGSVLSANQQGGNLLTKKGLEKVWSSLGFRGASFPYCLLLGAGS